MQCLKPLFTVIGYIILSAQLLFGYSAWATPDASNFPQLTGHVVDTANILDENTQQNIAEFLTAHEQATSNQIVVATIPTLNGENVEEYAAALFRHWGLGQDKNKGVLLLFAMADHKMRIEVGYGLEGELTDAKSKLIIDNILIPTFKAENYGVGVTRATQEIVNILNANQQYLGELPLPVYQGYLTDSLNPVATDERKKINRFLDNCYKVTGSKVAVVSTKADAEEVHGYASALFSHWQLSDKDILLVFNQPNTIDVRAGRDLRDFLIKKDYFQFLKGRRLTSSTDTLAELKVQLQQLVDAFDDVQDYPPLVESKSVLPEMGATLLLFCALFAILLLISEKTNHLIGSKAKKGKKKRDKQSAVSQFFIKTLRIVVQCIGIIALVSVGFSLFEKIGSIGSFYPLGGIQERVIDLGQSYLNIFYVLWDTWVVLFICGLVTILNISKDSGSSYNVSSNRYSNSRDSSSSSYSGGGGSSGGGGASGSW